MVYESTSQVTMLPSPTEADGDTIDMLADKWKGHLRNNR